MVFRTFDATAVNVISVYPKVQQILSGNIPPPEVAEFFITNYCSFRCHHCRCADTHEGAYSYIQPSLFKKIIDDLSLAGCKYIEFGGGGEPLEHPDILTLLQYIRGKNMRCGIITNGYALIDNEALVDEILFIADWIRISMDAVSNETFRAVHGRDDLSYDKLKYSLKSLAKKASCINDTIIRTRLGIKIIIQQLNQYELENSLDEALEIKADYLQFKWLENHFFAVPKEKRKQINECIRVLKAKGERKITIDFLPGYGGDDNSTIDQPCLLSVLHPLIDWDCNVYICAFFHHRKNNHCLGNLAKQTFEEIWNNPEHKKRIESVDRHQCVPNCPLKRYNPIVDFIKQEGYRFHYI